MQPYVPLKLLPWINCRDNTVFLKPGAPEEVKPLYEKLKANMARLEKEMLQGFK